MKKRSGSRAHADRTPAHPRRARKSIKSWLDKFSGVVI
jgi:hypothetical protein